MDDAAPLFGSSANVPHAGVLLAVPALTASGIFDCAQKIYGRLGPAFFGLRTTLLTLLFVALWRIKRPEGLKEHPPAELGRVLGVDRAPEVKTLRRKLARLAAWQRAEKLEARRSRVPRRVPVQSVSSEPVVKLAPEIQHLTNLVKMVACQVESDLLRTVAPHYRRVDDEGRNLIQSALANAADLEVTDTELRVTLAPWSSPHRTRALAALCEELNRSTTRFPGSSLGLRYAVREPP